MADERRTPIYRLLHGAPMLGGIPAHHVIVLLGVASVFGLGGMSVHKATGVAILCVVGLTWLVLAFIYGQDRARVPVVLLRLLYRFARRTDSYSPSKIRVRIEEE
jgi:uncharacterized membrane protein YtjA (UPF0391 family)